MELKDGSYRAVTTYLNVVTGEGLSEEDKYNNNNNIYITSYPHYPPSQASARVHARVCGNW